MKIIDKYIIKKFLGTFIFAISVIMVIVVVFDISENIEDFISNHAPLKEIIFVFYANFLPYFINLFSPLIIFISVIIFTGRMAYNTEIVAILSNGISFKRLMLPYLISSICVCTLSFCLMNFVIPNSNSKRIKFEDTYIRRSNKYYGINFHKQVSPGTFIYLDNFNRDNNTGYQFFIEKIEKNVLKSKLSASTIRWDSLRNHWILENYVLRKFNGMNESLIKGVRLDTVFEFTSKDFKTKIQDLDGMNFNELNKFIREEKAKGNEKIVFYEVEKHKRTAYPFATVILTFIGFSLSSRKVRGGIGMHIGAGIVISFAYILFMQISVTFATNSNLPALIAVWIPNTMFGILGLYLMRTAPK